MLQFFTSLITFGATPVPITISDVNGNPITRVSRIFVEPCVGNLHDCYLEAVGVAPGANGGTDGVIKRLGVNCIG
jgi:hypothetical protein